MKVTIGPWQHADAPAGVEKLTYASPVDGREDWALARRPAAGQAWVVHLHGHGASGDQVYSRPDTRQIRLAHYLRHGLGILSPNLRGNAWMCPEAVADLSALLSSVRAEYGAATFYFLSGSMGGTGNLIYATIHPEDVSLLAALCPATDLASYHQWCGCHPGGVRDDVRRAIEAAYGGSPAQVPERYRAHSVVEHAERLTMPLLFSHATGDDIIPVEQSRRLRQALAGAAHVTYVEIAGGNHDSPLQGSGMLPWLDAQLGR